MAGYAHSYSQALLLQLPRLFFLYNDVVWQLPEHEAEQIHRTEGIPLIPAVVNELRAISQDTGVPFE